MVLQGMSSRFQVFWHYKMSSLPYTSGPNVRWRQSSASCGPLGDGTERSPCINRGLADGNPVLLRFSREVKKVICVHLCSSVRGHRSPCSSLSLG